MVSIVEVTTKAQLRRFVEYPMELYKDVPQYIPGTYDDDLEDWDKKKNPAFEYCQARCWLAMRDGEIVGRIGAILSRKANEKWHTNRLRFTQVDFIDDYQVSRALFATVEDWARQLGCTQIHGPLGFTDLDREGLLVEGFDRRSCFFTYYNHPIWRPWAMPRTWTGSRSSSLRPPTRRSSSGGKSSAIMCSSGRSSM